MNPYMEVAHEAVGTEKVTFVDFRDGVNVHEYRLQDAEGAYPNYITSISGMLDTYRTWCQQEELDPDLQLPSRLARAQQAFKASKSGISGYRFNASVPVIRQIFTDYINHVSVLKEGLPMTFFQRRQLFHELQEVKPPKNVDQFIPSDILSGLERWIAEDMPTFTPFEHLDHARMVGKFLVNDDPQFQHLEHERLRAVFRSCATDLPPLTGMDIAVAYTVGRDAGTAIHAYLEYRLTHPQENRPEMARERFPLREDDDYRQAEDFVNTSGLEFAYLELRLASFRHKLCGSVDAIRRMPDGTLVIHDHKRTPVFNDKAWFRVKGMKKPCMADEALSGDIVKYTIQMAGYRKLLLLNGEPRVSSKAYLHVFHPSLRHWALVELDMDAKLRADVKGVFKGLGDNKPVSAMELVECLFQFFETQLQRTLRLK